MTLLFIFAYGLFALVTLYFMAAPFLGSAEAQMRTEVLDEELKRVEQLVARKAMLLNSLRELEFEHETAKVSEEDFQRYRKKYERQAVAIMRQLDNLYGGRGWEDEVDLELQARLNAEAPKTKKKKKKVKSKKKAVEPKPESKAGATIACAKCAASLEADDRFCAQCGATVGSSEDEEATA